MLRKLLSSSPISADLGLLVLRFATGGILVKQTWPIVRGFDGLPKDYTSFGQDTVTFLCAIVAFVGGALVTAGLLTRAGAFSLIILQGWAFYRSADMNARLFEMDGILLASAICIFLAGPGRFALDAVMGSGGDGGSKSSGKSKDK